MGKVFAAAALLLAACVARAADPNETPLARLQQSLEKRLAPGLTRSQPVITLAEYEFISMLSRQPRLTLLVYMNQYGEVRWFQDPVKITETYEQFTKEMKLPTGAISLAVRRNTTVVMPTLDRRGHYALAVRSPGGGLLGVVSFVTDGANLDSVAAFAKSYRAPPGGSHGVTAGYYDEDHLRQSQQHCLSGIVYYQNGDITKAREEWDLAVKLDPNNRDAWEWLGLK